MKIVKSEEAITVFPEVAKKQLWKMKKGDVAHEVLAIGEMRMSDDSWGNSVTFQNRVTKRIFTTPVLHFMAKFYFHTTLPVSDFEIFDIIKNDGSKDMELSTLSNIKRVMDFETHCEVVFGVPLGVGHRLAKQMLIGGLYLMPKEKFFSLRGE